MEEKANLIECEDARELYLAGCEYIRYVKERCCYRYDGVIEWYPEVYHGKMKDDNSQNNDIITGKRGYSIRFLLDVPYAMGVQTIEKCENIINDKCTIRIDRGRDIVTAIYIEPDITELVVEIDNFIINLDCTSTTCTKYPHLSKLYDTLDPDSHSFDLDYRIIEGKRYKRVELVQPALPVILTAFTDIKLIFERETTVYMESIVIQNTYRNKLTHCHFPCLIGHNHIKYGEGWISRLDYKSLIISYDRYTQRLYNMMIEKDETK